MRCPYCNYPQTKVTDKRDSGSLSRRRRECIKCEKRFTTYERVELDLNVIKKDGRREKFSREKIFKGVAKSLEKRPFTSDQIEKIVDDIESRVYRIAKDSDIKSSKIGEIIMAKLEKVDKVAYIRFASVYREFTNLEEFKKELKKIK